MNTEMLTALMVQGYRKKRGRRPRLKPISPSRRVELWYAKELLKIVDLCIAESQTVINNLKKHSKFVGDSLFTTRWDEVKSGNIDMLYIRIDGLAADIAGMLVQKEQDDVNRQLSLLIEQVTTVNISSILSSESLGDLVTDSISANVGLIKSIPRKFFSEIESIVNNGFQNGYTYRQIQSEILAVGESTKKRAKLIARDQVGKLNGQFNQARQESLGIDGYTWDTSGDERVRDSHRALDGKKFKWNKPPAVGHPGQEIQCRCAAIPDIDGMLRKRDKK